MADKDEDVVLPSKGGDYSSLASSWKAVDVWRISHIYEIMTPHTNGALSIVRYLPTLIKEFAIKKLFKNSNRLI